MSNMMDYLLWRGDLSNEASPWNLIDSMICATFCYVDLGDAASGQKGIPLKELAASLPLDKPIGDAYPDKCRLLLKALADTVRFSDILVHHYINQVDTETQFSAVTLDVPDGPRVIAFRGTDASLIGWKEDFSMSFETVPAQLLALQYLRNAIDTAGIRDIITTGHSKGGNLAAYASACLDPAHQSRIASIVSLDGPGLSDRTLASEGYARIRPILHSIIPQGSIVGFLMGFHPRFTVIRSNGKGIYQHDNFTWQLNGPAFEELDSNDRPSQFINATVHDWLRSCSREQRRNFVSCLFDVLESGDAVTTYDLSADKGKTLLNMIAANRELDPEARKCFYHMLKQLFASGMSNAFGLLSHQTNLFLTAIKDLLPRQEETPHLEDHSHAN